MDHRGPELRRSGDALDGGRTGGLRPSLRFVLVLALVGSVGAAWSWSGGRPGEFSRTFASPDDLAREVLFLLEAGDVAGLHALALNEEEFEEHVWPEMPARQGIPVDFAWDDLDEKSQRALARTVARHGRRRYELLDVRFTEVTPYQTFLVHRRARLRVRDERGREGAIDVFGSVLEKDKRFKLFSFVVNR